MSTDSRDAEFGLGLTSRPRVLSLPQRVGAVLPIPPLVMGTIVFQVGLIGAYMQTGLVAKGHHLAAAAVGRFVVAAMVVASTYALAAVFVAIMRVLGSMAVEYTRQRRMRAQRIVLELDRYREQEEKLAALAVAVKRERDGTGLPLAS